MSRVALGKKPPRGFLARASASLSRQSSRRDPSRNVLLIADEAAMTKPEKTWLHRLVRMSPRGPPAGDVRPHRHSPREPRVGPQRDLSGYPDSRAIDRTDALGIARRKVQRSASAAAMTDSIRKPRSRLRIRRH